MLASGLNVGRDGADLLPLQLLADYVTGGLLPSSSPESLLGSASGANVARVVVAGGATGGKDLSAGVDDFDVLDVKRAAEPVKVRRARGGICTPLRAAPERGSSSNIKPSPSSLDCQVLDAFLNQIASHCEVDVMPGPSDPVSLMMPQSGFHPCLLPTSSEWQSLNLAPNPYSARIGRCLRAAKIE